MKNKAPRKRKPHTEETKRKMSVAMLARTPAELVYPELKKCSRCGEWKNTVRDFPWGSKTLKSGYVRWSPYSRCRVCEAKRVAEYKRRVGKDVVLKRERQARRRRVRERRKREKALRRLRVEAWPLLYWLVWEPVGVRQVEYAEWSLTTGKGDTHRDVTRWELLDRGLRERVVKHNEAIQQGAGVGGGTLGWPLVMEVALALDDVEAVLGLYPGVSV